jgi:hypothetical protein
MTIRRLPGGDPTPLTKRTEFDTPKADRFAADCYTALS